MLTLNTGPSRLGLAAILAAPLVYGLFLAANLLITVEEVSLTETENRLLSRVTPDIPEQSDPREPHKPVPVETEAPPPFLPREAVQTDGGAPVGPVWTGDTPFELDVLDLNFLPGLSSPMDGRNLVAVREPMPSIPPGALARGISGRCDVRFDVDTAGRPQNVSAQCTDNVFKAEAERSVRRAEFLPAIRNGQPVIQKNAVYPIEFLVE